LTAVLYDQIYKKLNNLKTLTIRFAGIVVSGLVSGSYYNERAAGDIDAWKPNKTIRHSVRTPQGQPYPKAQTTLHSCFVL